MGIMGKNFIMGIMGKNFIKGRTVLCPTVQWLDSAVSNCPMVGQ